MDIYDLFSKFELDRISKKWVQDLWKDDFSQSVEFPAEYEVYLDGIDIADLILNACNFIKDWLEYPDSTIDTSSASKSSRPSLSSSSLNVSHNNSKSWQNLISNNVKHRSLVAMLSIFILNGKTGKSFEEKRLGVLATNMYLLILAIPGSQVFHIFNPILYSHGIENLKIGDLLTKSNKSKEISSKKRRSCKQIDSDEDLEGNHCENKDQLSHSEKVAVVKMLDNSLDNLKFTLKWFQLKEQDDSLLITIQILILITRLERCSSTLFINTTTLSSTSNLSYKAYKILLSLCSSEHGDVKITVGIMMKEIMQGLLIFDKKEAKMIGREAVTIKDHSVQFIRYLLQNLKDGAYSGVYTLIQHTCLRIPDKADLKAKGVQIVMELLNVLPYSLYSPTVIWIMRFCHSEQAKNRTIGLEIVNKLLLSNTRVPNSPLRPFIPPARKKVQHHKKSTSKKLNDPNKDEDGEQETNDSDESDGDTEGEADGQTERVGEILTQLPDFSTTKYLLATVLSRCCDTSSSVRAKALTVLANLISSNNVNIQHEIEDIFITPYMNCDNVEDCDIYEKGFFDFHHFLKNMRNETNGQVDPLPSAKTVISLIEKFIEDEKVLIRKSSIQVIVNILLLNEKWISISNLELLVSNCRDTSVSIRKLLVQCLNDLLLRYPSHPQLPSYWVRGILPLLADQEIKSQEKVLEVVQMTILDNLVGYHEMQSSMHMLPWLLLGIIADNQQRQLFLFACHKWSLTNCLKQSLITIIETHIGTENNTAAWFLLACISEYQFIEDPQFVLDYFEENVLSSQNVDEYCSQLVTEVMHLNWRRLAPLAQINLCDGLLRYLAQFTVPLPLIARCIDICHLLTEKHTNNDGQARIRIKEWAVMLINTCESRVERIIGPESPLQVEDEARLSQYIFTIGEITLICPHQLSHSTLLLIQNLLVAELGPEEDDEGVGSCAPERKWQGQVSATVQAVAITALGKLCLQKERTAKVVVPLFAGLLSVTSHMEIKINAMIVLTDMCIRFTSLVEHHLPEMSVCLRDSDVRVRENTLKLLIQLIQEDYLKLRCPMMFHLLTLLEDEYSIIRDMVSSFFLNSLLVKQKNVLLQHFVESLFHYSGYQVRSVYSKSRMMTPLERAVFSLEGPQCRDQRRRIYAFMLENMPDEHRFTVTYRLCTEILAGVADGEIELSQSGTTLLQDALYVLSSEEIKLSHMRGQKEADDDDEVADDPAAANYKLGKIIVSQVIKTNTIENIVPIFIKLKHKLQQLKSLLVRDLMACLRVLMKDFKAEINEILSADTELAAEILHDLENSGDEEEKVTNGSPHRVDQFKKVVMGVMALNEVRKSLNKSKSDTPPSNNSRRTSKSPRTSQPYEKSPLSHFSTPASNRLSPCSSKSSLGSMPEDTVNGQTPSPQGSSEALTIPGAPDNPSQRRNRMSSCSSTSSRSSQSKTKSYRKKR